MARGPELSKVRSITELCGLRVSVKLYVAPNGHLQCKRWRFEPMQPNCGYAPQCVACGGSHLSGGCYTPREQDQCCGCGGKHTANYRGCVKWKEARAALVKQAPERARNNTAIGHHSAPKIQRAGPSAQQTDLGEEWNHVVRKGRVVKATTTPTNSNPKTTPQPVPEVPRQPKVTATRKTAGPKKPQPKSTAATKPAAGKLKKKSAASVKTAAAEPTTPDLVVPTQSPTSPLRYF